MNKTDWTLIVFKNNLKIHQLEYFRGAILKALAPQNILFHNHEQIGYRYSYPLVQYKKKGDQVAILCINESIPSIKPLIKKQSLELHIKNSLENFTLDSIECGKDTIQIQQDLLVYQIKNWMPLNQTHYKDFMLKDNMIEQIEMLEGILVGNILSMCKGLEIFIEDKIECQISSLKRSILSPIRFKGIKMMIFDIEFLSNIELPSYFGLGKGVSLGFGTLEKKSAASLF